MLKCQVAKSDGLGWNPAQFDCLTSNKTLVAGQDVEFTCNRFSIPSATAVGILFSGTAGTVTIKRALIQ